MSYRKQKYTKYWYGSGGVQFDAVVVIDEGQSNSQARGEVNQMTALTPYTDTTPDGCYVYWKTSRTSWYDDGEWQPMNAGVNTKEPGAGFAAHVSHGAEISLATKLRQRYGKDVYYIKTGENGSSLHVDWNVTSVDDNYVISMANYVDRAISKLIDQGKRVIVIAAMWHQGETSVDNVTNLATYEATFLAKANRTRSYNAYFANTPVIITKIHYNVDAAEANINAVFDSIAVSLSNCYVMDVATPTLADATYPYPRNQDVPLSIRNTYPPTTAVDQHNSTFFQIRKGEMAYDNILVSGSASQALVTEDCYEYRRAVARATLESIPVPSEVEAVKHIALITALKAIDSGEVWRRIIGLYLFANNSGNRGFSTINIKNPHWRLATYAGTPTQSGNGVAFNGTNQSFGTNFSFNTKFGGTWYNNIGMAQLIHTFTNKIAFGMTTAFYYAGDPDGTPAQRVFWGNTTPATTPAFTLSTKFFAMTRSNANDFDYYVDDTKTTVTATRDGLSGAAATFGTWGGDFGNETISAGLMFEHLSEDRMLAVRAALVNWKATL